MIDIKVINKSIDKVSIIFLIWLFKLEFIYQIFNFEKLTWYIRLLFYCWVILLDWAGFIRIWFLYFLWIIFKIFLVWKLHKWVNDLFLWRLFFNNFRLHNSWSTFLNSSNRKVWNFWWRFTIYFLSFFLFSRRLIQLLFILNRWLSLRHFFVWNVEKIFGILSYSFQRILNKTNFWTTFRQN